MPKAKRLVCGQNSNYCRLVWGEFTFSGLFCEQNHERLNTDRIGELKPEVYIPMPEDNINLNEPKKILGAAINVGSNSLRFVVVLEYFVFPFFCFWFIEHSLNIFRTWKTFEYFICAAFFAPGGAVFLNWQSKILKTKEKRWNYYDPRLYALLPLIMAIYEKQQSSLITFHESFLIVKHIDFWIMVVKCDIYWLLLMSPLLLLAWTCRKTATNVLKNTLNEDNKNELREIITKNL